MKVLELIKELEKLWHEYMDVEIKIEYDNWAEVLIDEIEKTTDYRWNEIVIIK